MVNTRNTGQKMEIAEEVAVELGNDGTHWPSDADAILDEYDGLTQRRCESWRIEFDDGSAITGNVNGWDIEGEALFSFRG